MKAILLLLLSTLPALCQPFTTADFAAMRVATQSAAAAPTTATLGWDETEAKTSPSDATNRIRCAKLTVPNSGTLTRIRVYCENNSVAYARLICGVWLDGASGPGSLKAQCAAFNTPTLSASGVYGWSDWQTLTAEAGQDLSVSASQVIWIGKISEHNTTGYAYRTVTSGEAESGTVASFALADGPFTDGTRQIVIQVEYEY